MFFIVLTALNVIIKAGKIPAIRKNKRSLVFSFKCKFFFIAFSGKYILFAGLNFYPVQTFKEFFWFENGCRTMPAKGRSLYMGPCSREKIRAAWLYFAV
jgi:hypothetical protein